MILFHGSIVAVEKPEQIPNARRSDFGKGFYTTTNNEQAVNWARIKCDRKKSDVGYVSSYQISDDFLADSHFSRKIFDGPSREWLEFIISNRLNTDFSHSYDIVKGPVANDRVYACLNAFENRFMKYEQVIEELKTYVLVDQVSFHTEKSLELLHFIKYKEIYFDVSARNHAK